MSFRQSRLLRISIITNQFVEFVGSSGNRGNVGELIALKNGERGVETGSGISYGAATIAAGFSTTAANRLLGGKASIWSAPVQKARLF